MKQVKLYYTSDIHGYLFPTDYADTTVKPMGLLQCMTDFEKDGNTLILDGGDMLQGSALATYCQENRENGFPQAEVLNEAGYDFVTLGNHDFNFGVSYLETYLEALQAPCLCQNVLDTSGQPLYPATIKTLENGVKVGLVGIVTDYVNIWEKPEHLSGVQIADPFEAAKQALAAIKEQVDVTICLYHGGFERSVTTGEVLSTTTENIGYRICQELSFDVLLTGHQHLLIPGQEVHGTYVVQPNANGVNYFQLLLTQEADGWQVVAEVKKPTTVGDSTMKKQLQPLEQKVQDWLDQGIGSLPQALPTEDKLSMALHGNGAVELIGQVQLAESQAQLTVVSLANTSPGFHQEVTMRDVIATYPYTNQLITLEITGKQLKEVLEKNADYFALAEGTIVVNPSYLFPKVEHYNYDFFFGIHYVINVVEALGKRVEEVTYQGQPVTDTDTFTIALGDYRASGGGNFPTYRHCPVVKEGGEEIVSMLVRYLRQPMKVVTPLDFQILAPTK